ncbi:mediator of RNA polymerase II transcription subunit 1-domain-containing protein [Xylariaceae sp. FL0255]|nr:mediator of RNA polymerase II transcription subunit 1-domain-containing protein [Xylariaceae sp. FL0255]
MSTPMRYGHSQQGAAPTPQASTPFSNSQAAAAFSPHGPRSSPQQLKKSPANMMAGNMIAQPGNPPLNFDSPSAAAALGGLGLNDLNLDNISVGGLVGGAGHSDEDDRRKRLDAVVAALRAFDTGRVSNDGLERLAVHLGLECLWEGGAAENDKTLIIAGTTMAIEIGIKNQVVHTASLSFNEPSPSLEKHAEKASTILFKDLALGPGESQLTKKLSHFRANLERLATLDRLSVTPSLNCHEAIAGLWESLDQLHKWDVESLRSDGRLSEKGESRLRVHALCNQHGCPLMHTRGRIGLSLDYWKQNNAFKTTTVDTDSVKTWGILVDCAPVSSVVYSPIRVSDKWIAPNIIKTNPTENEVLSATGPLLDWLEPPNTLIPPSEEAKADSGLDPTSALSVPKPPDVAFIATFDPQVVVPHGVAMEIYKLSGTNAPPPSITFDAILFPVSEEVAYDPFEPREMTYTQRVPTFFNIQSGQKSPELKKHRNTLLTDRAVFGQVLTQVPFSHPRELMAMLPMLRQFAFLDLLLSNSFKPRDRLSITESSTNDNEDDSSDDLMVDIVLSLHPVPRLRLVFPFRQSTAMINLEIQLGGRVHISSDNIFSDSEAVESVTKGKGKELSREQYARKLELCEDIGMWVEFIKLKLE